MKRLKMRRCPGNAGNLMATAICMLSMTVILLSYMENVGLLQQKEAAGQLARKYILRMETVGYLTPDDMAALTKELQDMGVTDIDYTGSTIQQVHYGEKIMLQIHGKLEGEYDFAENRSSTAKN